MIEVVDEAAPQLLHSVANRDREGNSFLESSQQSTALRDENEVAQVGIDDGIGPGDDVAKGWRRESIAIKFELGLITKLCGVLKPGQKVAKHSNNLAQGKELHAVLEEMAIDGHIHNRVKVDIHSALPLRRRCRGGVVVRRCADSWYDAIHARARSSRFLFFTGSLAVDVLVDEDLQIRRVKIVHNPTEDSNELELRDV